MNKIFASAMMAVAMMGCVSEAEACSNFIVGKKASVDGSVMCSYSADDYGMFQNLCHYPAAKHAKGEMRKIYDWDTNKYHGEIPEAAQTYSVIGNINEWQVTIGETTYGGREEMVDSYCLYSMGTRGYGMEHNRDANPTSAISYGEYRLWWQGLPHQKQQLCG